MNYKEVPTSTRSSKLSSITAIKRTSIPFLKAVFLF